ncbi:MAG: VCBS repeat-containing protein [Phycisphaeraceae bacterium]|nr:VCBS repeat-containing protein [Phycisphaeraceae bacterium]
MRNGPMCVVACSVLVATGAGSAAAQPAEGLGRYFGFDPMRTIVVDDGFGPMVVGDFNGDGRPDLAIVNNRKSRIEVYYLRDKERTEAERERVMKANELPPSPWYDREDISVAHRVQAIRSFDVDGDGKLDIVYAGASPNELVVMRQESPSKFTTVSKREVKGLASRQQGLAIADVIGDEAPEIIAIADDRIQVFPLSRTGTIGQPSRIGTSAPFAAFFVEDYNGDGLQDVLGVVPEASTPLRLWLQRQDPRRVGKSGLLASELRFEMPSLREVENVRLPGRAAASIAVIERVSKRMVLYDLINSAIEPAASLQSTGGERRVRAEVWAFDEGSNKDRAVRVVDLDADGRLDLLATNQKSNTIDYYRQAEKVGLGAAEPFSALKKPKSIATGRWATTGGPPEVFVLSEEEKTVGVSQYDAVTGRLSFPVPISVKTPGAVPVAMNYVTLGGEGMLAVVVKDKRDHTLELHKPVLGADGAVTDEVTSIELKGVSRPPQSLLAADADQDGHTDLMLFTPSEPMVLVRATGKSGDGSVAYEVLTDKQMSQFGLVQAAGPDNTELIDMDGDGKPELLIADENFIRACKYNAQRGWSVVDQITMAEPGTKFAGLSTLKANGDDLVVAADKGNGRLVLVGRGAELNGKPGPWRVRDQLKLMGFPLGPIFAGSFAGDGEPSILCVSDDGFALVRLGGQRAELDAFAARRADDDDRVEHEIEVGDINSDGKIDLVVLDGAERMCEIFSISDARKILPGTEFEVFQSRLFTRGRPQEGEPRGATVADATGDGKPDVIIQVHDRVIIYPQATKPR